MEAAVVVPWRHGCPHRQAAWEWLRTTIPYEIIEGQCDGPWRKAAAVADGISRTDAPVIVVADADCWIPNLPDAVEALQRHRWAVPHRKIRRLTPGATARVLAGTDPRDLPTRDLEEPPYRAHAGGGVVVFRRDVWDEVPMDPRFVGWGLEDDAWGLALHTLAGRPWQSNAHLWHLWHPPQERTDRSTASPANQALYGRYVLADGKPDEMRRLIEEVSCTPNI